MEGFDWSKGVHRILVTFWMDLSTMVPLYCRYTGIGGSLAKMLRSSQMPHCIIPIVL